MRRCCSSRTILRWFRRWPGVWLLCGEEKSSRAPLQSKSFPTHSTPIREACWRRSLPCTAGATLHSRHGQSTLQPRTANWWKPHPDTGCAPPASRACCDGPDLLLACGHLMMEGRIGGGWDHNPSSGFRLPSAEPAARDGEVPPLKFRCGFFMRPNIEIEKHFRFWFHALRRYVS